MQRPLFLIVFLLLAAPLATEPAFAQNASGVVYNATKGVVLLASPGAASGAGGANCKTATTGAIRYNSTTPAIEFCNGTQWTALVRTSTSPAITAPAGSGYFVLSNGTWNDNLRSAAGLGSDGLTAGDALCLTDLTTHTGWMGYATANSNGQLVAGKVHAFLCSEHIYGTGHCNNLLPLTTYHFANALNSGAGGASFTTDSSGLGPNDSANWSGATYFSGSYTYKSDRSPSTGTVWGTTPYGSFESDSEDWSSTAYTDVYGISAATDGTRWTSGATNEAGTTLGHLVCFVNPRFSSKCERALRKCAQENRAA